MKLVPRMWQWYLICGVLMFCLYLIAPHQLPVILYKGVLLALTPIVAYMIDRHLFARISDRLDNRMNRDIVSASRILARALIFVGVVLGVTLGI